MGDDSGGTRHRGSRHGAALTVAERLCGAVDRVHSPRVPRSHHHRKFAWIALRAYVAYYQKCRTHVSLDKDAPVSRPIATPTGGAIVAIPHLGGLHHHYERRAA